MRVAYFTDIQHRADIHGGFSIKESRTDTGSFSFNRTADHSSPCGESHLMDPQRLRMVHALVLSLGLRPFFQIVPVKPCSDNDLRFFHTKEYLDFLTTVSHEKIVAGIVPASDCMAFNVGPVEPGVDCTAFEGLMDYNRLVAGASLDAAYMLRTNQADIAINWSGGFHHAKRSNAAGFCYINDCVLAIVELLKTFDRVMYIDIDFHHGDGVEEAFYITDRVLTVSLHRFGGKKVFPGTGDLVDCGALKGKFHAVNVPLLGGIGDETYVELFKKVVSAAAERYGPDAIVLQAGADSLAGDSVGMENGSFNLSTKAHAQCVEFVRDLKKPLLVLGGGGYSKQSVARCWAINTAVLVGKKLEELPKEIPKNDFYYSQYAEKKLHVENRPEGVDFNTPGRINMIIQQVMANIANISPKVRDSSNTR